MAKYTLQRTNLFKRKIKKIVRRDKQLKIKVKKALEKMLENPFASSLNTHKAEHPDFGRIWSSKVTGDLRIRWDFGEKDEIILLTFGRHSGKDKIYR